MEIRSGNAHGHILLEQHDVLANPKVWPVARIAPMGTTQDANITRTSKCG